MHIEVNGAKLFFDIENSGLVPCGDHMAARPTLILLHGGPGADHSLFKPAFSVLRDVAQIVYLDHRGNGRSDPCTNESWNLAQWGDDVRAFCDALGIQKPFVYGVSFGGFVAQSYAVQHPEHMAGLILASTAAHIDFEAMFAAFERHGGPLVRDAARRYWLNPTSESRLAYRELCVPYYSYKNQGPPDWIKRAIIKDDVAIWFNGPNQEFGRMDFRKDLSRIGCPTLVMAGENDPLFPPEFGETIAQSIAQPLCEFVQFAECGHGIVGDQPEQAFAAIRDFISRHRNE